MKQIEKDKNREQQDRGLAAIQSNSTNILDH